MTGAAAFSEDYDSARERFRAAAAAAGYELTAHGSAGSGPRGAPLFIDAARIGDPHPARMVIVSSGLHGVEGFLGSAVQTFLLESGMRDWQPPPEVGLVLAHALNPYGFAHVRRFDESNIDLNRNFLLPGQGYEGAPPRYGELDRFLNPRYPPSRLDAFLPKAMLAIARYGFRDLKQAVAGGQYEYPQGLFFGGQGPSIAQTHLERLFRSWVGGAEAVLHVDLHTGLGRWAEQYVLLEPSVGPRRHAWVAERFRPLRVEGTDPNGISYHARGGLGSWLESLFPGASYTLLCAELGTYSPLNVLRALRDENQAHHWAAPDSSALRIAKYRLRETFAPRDVRWRDLAVSRAADVVRRVLAICRERVPAD
jgi:hypothetical protein